MSTILQFPFRVVRWVWLAEAQKFQKVIVLSGIIHVSIHIPSFGPLR